MGLPTSRARARVRRLTPTDRYPRDSNPRPLDLKSSILPLSYRPLHVRRAVQRRRLNRSFITPKCRRAQRAGWRADVAQFDLTNGTSERPIAPARCGKCNAAWLEELQRWVRIECSRVENHIPLLEVCVASSQLKVGDYQLTFSTCVGQRVPITVPNK